MPTAFVLLRVKLGAESEVVEALRKIDAVEEAYRVYGVYDTIVKVRGETMEKLKEIVTWKVRHLDKVQQTITMIVIE